MQTCQPKVLTPTTSPIAFYTLATVPCSNHWGQIPDNQDSLCAAGPIFPERAESRIKTLGGSPAPSASWQTPVFLHVVLHGLWFLSMCEYKRKNLLSSWQSFLCLHVLPYLMKTNLNILNTVCYFTHSHLTTGLIPKWTRLLFISVPVSSSTGQSVARWSTRRA